MAKGLEPREATLKAMEEITGPVIAITLVLSSVFIPTAFLTGISGQFYRQFALTIAASTIISAINALTMAPARAVQLIKPHSSERGEREALPRLGIALLFGFLAYWLLTPALAHLFGISMPAHGNYAKVVHESNTVAVWMLRGVVFVVGSIVGWLLSPLINRALGGFFKGFNWVFNCLINVYGRTVAMLLQVSVIVLLVYGGLLGLTYLGFMSVPTGFIPEQDKGYLVAMAQLPDGTNLERTEAVMARAAKIAQAIPGIAHTLILPGFSLLTGTNLSNAGTMFMVLAPFEERAGRTGMHATDILDQLRGRFWEIQDALVLAFGAPPVEGIGNTGGFKLQIQDRGDAGPGALQGAVDNIVQAGSAQPGLVGLFSTFRANEPQLYVEVDRAKAKAQGVALSEVFDTLQVYLGSAYVNDLSVNETRASLRSRW